MKNSLKKGDALLAFWLLLCFFVVCQQPLQARKVCEEHNSNGGSWPSTNTQSHRRVSDETDFVLNNNPYTISCSAGTISGTTTICQGITTQLSSDGGSGFWSSSNTAVVLILASNGVMVGRAAGTSIISYTVTEGACTSTATVVVTVNARPNADIAITENNVSFDQYTGLAYYNASYTDGILCTGPFFPNPTTSATLTASGGGTYLWNNSSTNNSITVSTAGTYSVVVTNAAGCANIAFQTISVNAAPSAGTISATPFVPASSGFGVCMNSTITLSSTVPGGVWVADPKPQPVISIDQTGLVMPLVSTIQTDSHSVFYRVTLNGCINSARTQVEVLDAPNAGTISGTTSICAGTTSQLSSNGTTAPNTIRTWSSNNTGVATVNASSGLVTGVANGMATITYTVTDFAGTTTSPILRCTSTTSTMVTVDAGSNAGTISGTTTICAGTTSQLTSNGDPGGTWSSSNDAVATVSASGLVTGVSGNSGTATITYTVTLGNCTNSTNVLVTVNASPSAGSISGNTSICSSPFLGNNTTQLSITGGAGGGTWASSNTNVATVNASGLVSSVPPSTNSGTSIISYTVTNGSCSNTATILITVNANPSALVTSTPYNACVNTDVTISVPDAGTDATYAWSGDITNTNSNTIISNSNIPGFKVYQVTVTAANGCSNTGFGFHIVNEPINTSITATPNPVCLGVTLSLSIPEAASTTVSWSGPGINSTTGFNTTASPTTTGLQTYTVTATTTPYLGSCVYTGTIDVMVETTQPNCNITGPTVVCPGSTSTFNAPGGLSGYSWGVTGDGTINGASNGASFSVIAGTSGTYTVSLTTTSASGCTNTCSQVVTINTVPSCISTSAPPNGQLGVPITASALSWDPVPNITHYLVYFGTNAPNYDNIFNGVNNGTSTSKSYTTLTPNTTYGYRIVPVNACGEAVGCPTITFSTCVPTFTCPANQNINLNASCAITIPDLVTGLAADPGCGALTFTQNPTANTVVTSSHNASVLVTITPNNPAVSSCQVTLTPKDVTLPGITCPMDRTVNATAGQCSSVQTYTITTTDNCSATTSQTLGQASGTSFPVGVTTNGFTATDAAGLSATCSFKITVVDNQPPTITCPQNRTVNATTGQCNSVQTYTVTASDNCSSQFTLTRTNGLANGSAFPLGFNVVNWQVTDVGGSTTICSFSITVVDNQLPSISCPNSTTTTATTGQCAAVVNYTVSGSDNCSGWSLSRTSGLQSGAQFPVGSTTVIWRNTDTGGNSTTCAFTVTVTDGQLPGITCPSNITANAATGICSATVNYTTPTVSDNCSGASVMHVSGGVSGSSFNKGVNTVEWKATDAANNTKTCAFTITVNDTQAPVISCPANLTASTAAGTCAATVTFNNATATDNCAPPPTVTQTSGAASGSSFTRGVHTIGFKATDGVNLSSNCTFRITVVDNVLPTITCPSNIIKNTDNNLCTSVTNYTVTGVDNCNSVSVSRVSGFASGSAFPRGSSTVVWRATDLAGNSTLCSFTVTVNDAQLPGISCPQNINVNTTTGQCNRVVNYTMPTYSDNCTGGSISLFEGLASGSVFPTGVSTVIWRAFDNSANSSTCSFTVTVTDNQLPTITCPPAATVAGSGSPCGFPSAQLNPASATDNCAVTSLTRNAPTNLPAGPTVITWTASDAAGNDKTCAYTVTVNCGSSYELGVISYELGEPVLTERSGMNDAERESASSLLLHTSSFTLSPNPASGMVVITLSNQHDLSRHGINNTSHQQPSGSNQHINNTSNQHLFIRDALGRLIWCKMLTEEVQQVFIDLEEAKFNDGVYQVSLYSTNGMDTKSLVVSKR